MTRIAGIVLAAGNSSRMGTMHNKLVEPIAGRPLVASPVDALIGAGVDPIFVVTGFEAERVRAALGDRPCRFLHHENWADGMGSSLAHGARAVRALVPPIDAVVVCVGDLPALRAEHVTRVVGAALATGGSIDSDCLVVPIRRGRRGHPVLFGAGHLDALARLTGDRGGRSILEATATGTTTVEIEDDAILTDVDTPSDLEQARIGSKVAKDWRGR